MAEDGLCQREMREADSCVEYRIQYVDGEIRSPVAYGDEEGEYRTAENDCHDCGISPGGIHHPGCDWAECPRCGGQLLGHEIGDPENCSRVSRYVLPGERYFDVRRRTTVSLGDDRQDSQRRGKSMSKKRHHVLIEDGTVRVVLEMGTLEVGPLSDVEKMFSDEHTISYKDWEKERYKDDPEFKTDDEGMTFPVLETIENMTLGEAEVEWLRSKPLEPDEDSMFDSGRMPLFLGFLSYNLDHGVK